jgi:hypothetical protein
MLTGSIIQAVKWLMKFLCWHTQRWHVQVKALPWYSSVRKIIVDPAYAGFFLHFKCNKSASDDKVLPGEGGCHVPRQNMTLYHGAPLSYRIGSFGPSVEAVEKLTRVACVCSSQTRSRRPTVPRAARTAFLTAVASPVENISSIIVMDRCSRSGF